MRGIALILVAGLLPAVASAQQQQPFVAPLPVGSRPTAAQPVQNMPATYEGRLARGHVLYKSADFGESLAVYEAAKELDPKNPSAYYFIACALSKMGRHDDAIATINKAISIFGDQDVNMHAKLLFVLAVIMEERGDKESAKNAWAAYLSYVQANLNALAFAGSATSRIDALEKKMKLDQDYKIVLERIAGGN